jgi:signal transduction histidine kinase
MRVRLLFGTLLVAFLMLGVGGVAAVRIQQNVAADAQERLFEQANRIAQVIDRIDTDGGQLTRRQRSLIEEWRRIANYEYLEVGYLTPAGLRITTDNPQILPNVGKLDTDRAVQIVEVDGNDVNVAIRIVDNSGQEIVIAIGSRAGVIDRALFNRPMVVATIVGLLAAIGLSLLVSQQLGKRIDALSDAAGAVAGGDFAARVQIRGSDEVTKLAGSFNDMAAELEDAQRRERDFLMSVGHDLRTPLTTIRGYAEALDAGRVDEDRMPRVAAVLHAQAQRLARLIEDLMLLSRLEAREFTLRLEPVNLTAHIAEAVEVLVAKAEPLDIQIESDLDELPVGDTDPDRISQIVGNLFDNALRYSPEGGTVRVALSSNGETARISVSDNGPGIDPTDLPHVFERLYVAQRYQAVRPEGSGLGLAIVAQLVDALGGDVQVESVLGEGTTVHVAIPWQV